MFRPSPGCCTISGRDPGYPNRTRCLPRSMWPGWKGFPLKVFEYHLGNRSAIE